MKVLDLFCGVGGWSKAFHEAGHECTGIDIKNIGYPYRFIKADLNDWEPDQDYDIILASPPCTEFSIAKKWWWGTQDERMGLDLVYRAFYLIELIKPKYWIIENVKGLSEFLSKPTDIVRYGKRKQSKAAYLWSNIGKLGFLDSLIIHKIIMNKKMRLKYGPQSKTQRALIPYPLSKAVLDKIKLLE